jgi:GntR family transcriptional repressor for pyruvate dehydrogenase complex
MTPKTQPLQKVHKTTVVEEVLAQLKEWMRSQAYPPRSKFPSERDMARQLGVSLPSVREALRTLSVMGVVDTRHGSGTRVADSSANILKVPFEFLMMLDQPSVVELHQARELIEVYLAGCAAHERTPRDLEAMEAALREMGAAFGDASAMIEPDVRFHEAIAAAAHNRVLQRVMSCLHGAIRHSMEAGVSGVPDTKAVLNYHAEILEAIRRRKPEEARRSMMKHMAETAKEQKRSANRKRPGRRRA